MKFSLITPEHDSNNTIFLLELYQSIKNQTYKNWEWILYLNGDCTFESIPSLIKNDSQVIIKVAKEQTTHIGLIKNTAFYFGSGDILVEVDHDDILISNCLEELFKAFQDNEIGFVYSNTATLHMDDKFIPHNSNFGWTFDSFYWNHKKLTTMHSFQPTSHSLSYIWYAPDHVRAWRKSVYHELGGHNKELDICDDHELCIRTYLHTKMYLINKPLYIYRITGKNTWLERNHAIQLKTVELAKQYSRQLAERDADQFGLLKVDLGGGLNSVEGYTSIDLRKNADYVHDLNNGIPLPDNSAYIINASHILEHLYDKTKIMSEIHRVLVHGGWAFIEIPSTDGRGAFQDPTHVSYWNENSFLYYTDAYLANFIENTTIKFQQHLLETHFPNEWLKNMNVCVTTAWLFAIKKDSIRFPGPLKI
jgi:O-antigen biosynthesis protein